MFGEFAGFVFAVNEDAVDFDIEHAASSLDHFNVDIVGALDCFRQTGGFGFVVSLHAILYRNVHFASPALGLADRVLESNWSDYSMLCHV